MIKMSFHLTEWILRDTVNSFFQDFSETWGWPEALPDHIQVHVQAVVLHQCHRQALHGGRGEGFISRLRVSDCPLEQRWHHFFPAGKRRQREAAWGAAEWLCCQGTVWSVMVRELIILLHVSPVLWKQSDSHCHLKGLACPEILFFGTVSAYSLHIRPYMTCCLFRLAAQCVGFDR